MSDLKQGIAVIKSVADGLSTKAGVYRMLDNLGQVLYVGKAKNLKNRVSQYTRMDKHPIRIQRMIFRTASMQIVETASESEALLLEADLIKSLRPYYNILLRDDKSYPEIELKIVNGNARIKKHRGLHQKGCRYFGPFASASAVNKTIAILENVFQLGGDYENDKQKSSYRKRYYPVLKHQFMRTFAPNTNKIKDTDFDQYIKQVMDFLSGRDNELTNRLKQKMITASEQEDFEMAGIYRDRLQALNELQISQGQAINGIGDADVIALKSSGAVVCIQVLFYRNFGCVRFSSVFSQRLIMIAWRRY